MNIKTLFLFFCAFWLYSCAVPYKKIQLNPNNIHPGILKNGLEFSYRNNIMLESGNIRYAKKEKKKQSQVVAIKITNFNDSTITIGKDFLFTSNNQLITIIDGLTYKKFVKQGVAGYLLYCGLAPFKLYMNTNNEIKTYKLGLILGIGSSLSNMAIASNANDELKVDIDRHNAMYRQIKPKETFTGVIVLHNYQNGPIDIKWISNDKP